MPVYDTKNFGPVPYEASSVLEFPSGLPGFEERRGFLPLQFKDSEPAIFLQSMEDPNLCFITLPVLAVDPQYRLRMADEDLAQLGFAAGCQPEIGRDVLVVTVVSARESGPTANLLAPVVVNLRNRRAVQAVVQGSSYSHQHALVPEEAHACS